MFFSAITKNLNQENLSKTLVAFKRWNGVKNETFLILRGYTEKSNFQWGGSQKTNV